MFFEPLASAEISAGRAVMVRDQRTKTDWAACMKQLLDRHYPDVEQVVLVVLVMDNLNTHCVSSFYEAFAPAEARRLTQRLEIHYTPEHGSWLNMAEIENSAMARQCLSHATPSHAAHPGESHHGRRNVGLVRSAQRSGRGGGLAVPDRRRPHQTSSALPKH